MASRPDLLIGESMVRLAGDNVLSEQSSNRPKVYLEGTYQQDYPGFGSSVFGGGEAWQRSMNGGVSVEWPIFDGLRTDGLVTQAKAEVQRQQVFLRRLDQQVQFEVNQALLDLRSSEEFVQSQLGNVENAEEALRLARVNFRRGNGTSLDVISAELGLSEARSDYSRAVHGYQVSLLKLHWALGTLGEREIGLKGMAVYDESGGAANVQAEEEPTR
jgi:outer membrane protein TolC